MVVQTVFQELDKNRLLDMPFCNYSLLCNLKRFRRKPDLLVHVFVSFYHFTLI